MLFIHHLKTTAAQKMEAAIFFNPVPTKKKRECVLLFNIIYRKTFLIRRKEPVYLYIV